MTVDRLYNNTDRLFTSIALVWAVIAVSVGLHLVKPIVAIVIPLMGIFMFFASSFGVRFISSFQNINPFLKNKKIINYFDMFVWYLGIFSTLFFLLTGLYFYVVDIEYGAYLIMICFFPLGASVGAFKSRQSNA